LMHELPQSSTVPDRWEHQAYQTRHPSSARNGRGMTQFQRTVPVAFLTILVGTACTSAPADAPFRLTQIGPNAWAAIDNASARAPATANGGFVLGDEGVLVVDTLGSIAAADLLLAEIRKRTSLPVTYVVNPHYHLDHVAGNGVFARAGAIVFAHENVRDWIRRENARLLGPQPPPELEALIQSVAEPTIVYDEGMRVHLGGHEAYAQAFPGHTGGDSIVLIRDSRIAFLGDLFWNRMLPNLIDASTQPWIASLDTLLAATDAGYTFVPGHGDVGSALDVAAFRDYLMTLRRLVGEARARGYAGGTLVDAVMPALKEQYGRWEFVEPLAKDNVLQTEAELSGTKRIPGMPSAR
jgi:cyclase